MASKMMRFTTTPQATPAKRDAHARRRDFDEITRAFAPDAAAVQASRCEQCGVPFCQLHCPLSNNIPDWLMLTATGRLEEAYRLSQATNSFPEICGRICPQDRLCEGSCVLEQSGHGTMTIGAVEKYITEQAFQKGWVKPPLPLAEQAGSVAIVGAGPAGLAGAGELRRRGWTVSVYDRHDRAGGLLTYGIPGFKLDKAVVERRVRLLEEAGVIFHPGVALGRDVSLAELRARHDAVLIAIGVYRPRPLDVAGMALEGVHDALDYLIASNRSQIEGGVSVLDARGRDVVVIGGGDTAMDCVRTAIRQGARSVRCLYRRDRANMPGSAREVAHAEEEGVDFVWQTAPLEVLGKDRVDRIRVVGMNLGIVDSSGRRTPVPVAGSERLIETDFVIKALGFEPEESAALFGEAPPATNRDGTLAIAHPGFMTSEDGVFAAGDIVRGASLVVWAVKDGQDAAAAIDSYLRAKASREAAE